jgi:lipopolysaccharide export LptBFGC system permease protein LptF
MTADEIIAALAGLSDTDELSQEIEDAIINLSDEDWDRVYAAIPEAEKVEVTDVNGDGDNDVVTADVDGDGTVDKATIAADSKKEADEGLKEAAKKTEPKSGDKSFEEKNPFNNYNKKDGASIKPEVDESKKDKPPRDIGAFPEETEALVENAKLIKDFKDEFGTKPTAGLQPMNRNIVSALRDLIL